MGYRVFRDSRGMEWQTWDVVPRMADRRINERRSAVIQPTHSERRAPRDRRTIIGFRPSPVSVLGGGWLCFEAEEEKRRLTPIPTDWQQCPVERLEQYCAQAAPAPAARRTLAIRPPRDLT